MSHTIVPSLAIILVSVLIILDYNRHNLRQNILNFVYLRSGITTDELSRDDPGLQRELDRLYDEGYIDIMFNARGDFGWKYVLHRDNK
jgi:hypothetical protein